MLRLDPPLPVVTPKGKAMAHVLIDYGFEHFLIFVCFIDDTGECWCFRNSEVKMQNNETMRPKQEATK